jgi:hypothetical protein
MAFGFATNGNAAFGATAFGDIAAPLSNAQTQMGQDLEEIQTEVPTPIFQFTNTSLTIIPRSLGSRRLLENRNYNSYPIPGLPTFSHRRLRLY